MQLAHLWHSKGPVLATIRKRNGKWHVQVRRKGYPSLTRSFQLKQHAETWARQQEAKADEGALPANPRELDRYTLGDLVRRYQDEVTAGKKGKEPETWRLNAFLRHPICSKTLSQLKPSDFACYRDERLRLVTSKTLATELSPIHNLFEVARDDWGLPLRENPLDRVKLKTVDNRRERRLKDGELQRLVEAAWTRRNPYILPIILFALETAMRRGEVLGLTWDRVDLKGRSVTILESKNGYSRTIPLTKKAVEQLISAIRVRHEYGKGQCHSLKGNPASLASLCEEDDRWSGEGRGQDKAEGMQGMISRKAPRVFPTTANALRLSWQRITILAELGPIHIQDFLRVLAESMGSGFDDSERTDEREAL